MHNEIWLSNKKECTTHKYNDMDKPQKHYAKWKKPDTKITYYSIYF